MHSSVEKTPLPLGVASSSPQPSPVICNPPAESPLLSVNPLHTSTPTTSPSASTMSPAQRIKAFTVLNSPSSAKLSPLQGFAASKRRMSGINPSAPLPLGIFSPQQQATVSPGVLAPSNVNVVATTAASPRKLQPL